MYNINIKKVQVSYAGFCDQCYGLGLPDISKCKQTDKYILTIGGCTIHLCKNCLSVLYNNIETELDGTK